MKHEIIFQFDIDLIYINSSVIIPASGGLYPQRRLGSKWCSKKVKY